MFIVVIFFLIYGVEVYFKVRTNPYFIDSKVMSSLSTVLSGVLKIIHPLVFGFNCLHRRFFIPIFYIQVRGGFLNDGEFSIPLGIISFKTASNPSSSSNPGPSTSSAADHDDKEGEEEKEEVTVRLMKEEAGLNF